MDEPVVHTSPTPKSTEDVVRWWLGTASWDESFEVLRAKKAVLVTQEGLDAVLHQADEQERSVHAAILQAIAGGLNVDLVQAIVVDRRVAREVADKALLNNDEPVLRVTLAMNTRLGSSHEGVALYLLGRLACGETESVVRSAEVAAASDADGAARVAERVTELARELPDELVPREAVAELVVALTR